MQISRVLITLLVIAGWSFITPANAFDASKVLKGDVSNSKTIFGFFFDFKKKGREDDAVDVLRYAAEKGNSAAQWKLGKMYQLGDGVEKDPLEAFKFFQDIASKYGDARPNTPNWQFSADALVALGNYYRKGIPGTSIKPDRGQARVMYTTAAMVFRHPDGQFQLARMQLENNLVFGHGKLGIHNLKKAYKRGHVGAEALLGYSVFEGEYIRRNPVRGLVMLGNARRRANETDLEWIAPLHDEAMALAKPDERLEAVQELQKAVPFQ